MVDELAGTMADYVSWDIENEHGDLDLGADIGLKPPLSMLGAKLKASRRPQAAQWLRNQIVDQADQNPAIARLRVDGAHENLSAIEDIDALPGQLPEALTAMFDASIARIKEQPQLDAELGLRALALWASEIDNQDDLLSELEATSIPESLCTIERVLHATGGFLYVAQEVYKPIVPYSFSFGTYVRGGYSDIVNKTLEDLRTMQTELQ